MHFKKTTAKFAASFLLVGTLVLPVLAVTGTVNSGNTTLNVRAEPSTNSAVIAKLRNGTQVEILETVNSSWYEIACDSSTTGFVSSAYVVESNTANPAVEAVSAPSPTSVAASRPTETAFSQTTYVKATAGLNIRSGPDTSYGTVGSLKGGQVVQALAKTSNNWYKISSGYISADYAVITDAPQPEKPATSKGQQVADYALQFRGYPYVYGGASPSGFDCSGFTQYVYKHFGYSINRTASAQMDNGKVVSKISDLKPGDLVFFKKSGSTTRASHVGVYIGNNKFVHASTPEVGVIVSKMSDAYYTSGFVGGRRIV